MEGPDPGRGQTADRALIYCTARDGLIYDDILHGS